MKYLEPGHTFMSADSFHADVEKSMKNRKIYDFQDFVDRVQAARSETAVSVKVLARQDVFLWPTDVDVSKNKNFEPRFYLRVRVETSHPYCSIV